MDPNANLEQQRAIRESLFRKEDEFDTGEALELIQLMADLDEWMSQGGAMPDAWELLR